MSAPDLLHNLTLGDLLREHARSRPDVLAAVDGDVRLTYPELDARVSHHAHALHDAGVRSGDRVLWLGQNSHRVLELLGASAKLGALFCPANWRQTADELAFVIDDLTPALIVWQEQEVGDAVLAARVGEIVGDDGAGGECDDGRGHERGRDDCRVPAAG